MGRFRSKAQWKAMFARKMPFARRWARSTSSYKSLPSRARGARRRRR